MVIARLVDIDGIHDYHCLSFLFIMWQYHTIIILLFHMQIIRLEKVTHFIFDDICILIVNNVNIKQRESHNPDEQYKISERYTN